MTRRIPRKVHHVLPLPRLDTESNPPFGREVAQEVDFLIQLMDLKPDEAILDVAAGAGRHALELARRGFTNVTAMDPSDQLLGIGARCAASLDLKVKFLKGDAQKPAGKDAYDAALVLGGGAFGLMESDKENVQVLDAVFDALKPGGRLALSAMSLLNLLRHRTELANFDPDTNYLTTTEQVPVEGDTIEEFPLHERYYVVPGLRNDLLRIGFRNIMAFGADSGRFSSRSVTTDDPEILMSAVKPKG